MIINFIRHGKTNGNLEKRYIGRTDESLCENGIAELSERKYPDCDIVITSTMKRCLETGELIYPSRKMIAVNGLEECDFGDFEGKNYLELSGNPDYQRWIDSGGKLTFPNGESPEAFKARCITAFEKAVEKYSDCEAISFVVHGGTIMAVLEKYAVPKRNYFDFHVKNGHGFITEFDGEKITITEQI